MRKKFLVLIAVSIPALISADWYIEAPYADTSGKSAAIGVSGADDPHIVYYVDGDSFYHAYKSSGAWNGPYSIEPVYYSTYCRVIDLAMIRDTANAIMSMEYTASGDYVLWGKHVGGGVWAIEQMPNTIVPSNSGGYLNVAICPGTGSELFHVIYVYFNYGSPVLYYRTYDGSWSAAEEVSPVPDVSSGWQNDIAVDANDDPHIAFVYSDEGIKYRKKTGGVWEPVELVSSTTDPTFASIAVDESNQPHVAYDKDDFGAVCYRYKTASGWQPEEMVGAGGGWNTYGASVAACGGEKFIAYYAAGDLKFATRTNTGWISEEVDTAGDVGTYASLVIDGEGYAHIAYRDGTNWLLKYARSTEPVVGITEANWGSDVKSWGFTIHAYPNPFHQQTRIRYSILARPASQGEAADAGYLIRNLTLMVYDASGRMVRSFDLVSSIENQESEVIWDGTDQCGQPVSSGVYFLRGVMSPLNGGQTSTVTKKLLLLR
ncbi:hypothetical protein IBX73_03945 [candidate division WOR-3 bacterium]|nr:hypothetical protein [candidate division WOR-3 bacterium]